MRVQHFRRDQNPYEGEGKNEGSMILMLDYHQRAFALLHEELERDGYRSEVPHPIRRRFWGLLPYRQYNPMESSPLVLKYINSVERELAGTIGKHSLAYWLHLYRRLSPGAIGDDKQPATVGQTRAVLEAAIQKYAMFEPCSRVGITSEIPIDRVLGGILMDPEFHLEREILKTARQLVLTDFSSIELREFYQVERLAYELWRSSAMLRIIGKGAPIIVDGSQHCVFDARSPELDTLVEVFDVRNALWDPLVLSATGVVLDEEALSREESGTTFLPTYNLGEISTDEIGSYFTKAFNITFQWPVVFNFIWLPFNLRQFREAHTPFAGAFNRKYGIELDAVLLVIAALCQHVFLDWTETGGFATQRYWQRAYEGPYTRKDVVGLIRAFVPAAAQLLNLDENEVDRFDTSEAIQFLELGCARRSQMDLGYAGPHSVFLPYGNSRVFIEYAWIARRLYSLFVGVNIPNQSFKGIALEDIVRFKESVLPVRACKSREGERKQIDAAFAVGERLVIVECKVVGKSIGFSRGNPRAIRFRNRVVNNALNEVDEKAHWLAVRPEGTNYDITRFHDILPIAITPFVEYVPSLHSRYWLTDNLPRVLTPKEFKKALNDGTLPNVKINVVPINKVS